MREILKDFCTKVVAPVLLAWLLYTIFYSLFTKDDGTTNYLYMWISCGLPFGVLRMRLWISPHRNSSLGYALAVWTMNFIIGGLIGGAILVWYLLRAAWYLVLTIYRLFIFATTKNKIENKTAVEMPQNR